MDLSNLDLAALAQELERALPAHRREGFVVGKTAMRDEVVRVHGCSQAEAERLIDTLAARGLVTFSGDPSEPGGHGFWQAAPRSR